MRQEIKIFRHEMFGDIRTMTNESGETFFIGKDVAEALGYKNPSNALQVHVDEEDKTSYLIQVSGSNYKANTLMINESGLYSLVLSSKLPQAKVFKHWVTSEVLPQIRKTGRYELLPKEVKRLAAQADYCQQVLRSVNCMTMTQVAKELGMTVYDLTRMLLQEGIIYYQSGQYMLYGDFARKGLAKTRTDYHEGRDGQTHTTIRLVWTESGRKMVHDIYNAVKKIEVELDMIEFC
jgi:prophage antirepressor-like protein